MALLPTFASGQALSTNPALRPGQAGGTVTAAGPGDRQPRPGAPVPSTPSAGPARTGTDASTGRVIPRTPQAVPDPTVKEPGRGSKALGHLFRRFTGGRGFGRGRPGPGRATKTTTAAAVRVGTVTPPGPTGPVAVQRLLRNLDPFPVTLEQVSPGMLAAVALLVCAIWFIFGLQIDPGFYDVLSLCPGVNCANCPAAWAVNVVTSLCTVTSARILLWWIPSLMLHPASGPCLPHLRRRGLL